MKVKYVAKCPNCEWEEIVYKHPPREKMCPKCRIWCKFEKIEE